MPPTNQDDDFAASAARHLQDASILFGQGRHDSSVYLSGYVAECVLKFTIERGLRRQGVAIPFGHDLLRLEEEGLELLVMLSASLRPLAVQRRIRTGILAHGHPQRRYWRDGWTLVEAEQALEQARELYCKILAESVLDGEASVYE